VLVPVSPNRHEYVSALVEVLVKDSTACLALPAEAA
jgi:hypothetical protein